MRRKYLLIIIVPALLILVFFGFLYAYTYFENTMVSENDLEEEKSNRSMKSVMVNKTQCTLMGEFKDLERDDIVGVWRDSLFWKMQPNDTCYYGVDELDKHIELEIKPTKTFVLSTTYSKPEYDNVEMGEYFLSYDSLETTLLLASNPAGEKLFYQGDTMFSSVLYSLRWVDSSTIILVSDIKMGGVMLKQGIEFKKMTSELAK